MTTAVTEDIKVTVECRYEAGRSDPQVGRYIHRYRITITNLGMVAVQLLHRHWTITDSLAPTIQVAGPGVVGETPVIAPGGSYTYASGCELRGSLGRMVGRYEMSRIGDASLFLVAIPAFILAYPHALN